MTALPKILLVDEDPSALAEIAAGLEGAGFTLVQATSSEEALQRLKEIEEQTDQTLPNLAVLQLSATQANGLTLASALLDQFNLPAIFLSDSDDKNLIAQAIEQGAISYLLKPVSMSTLLPLVRSCAAKADEISSIYSMKKHLSLALSSGAETSIATGILMQRFNLTDEKAFELIRNHARSERRKLQEVASSLVLAVETLNQLKGCHEILPESA